MGSLIDKNQLEGMSFEDYEKKIKEVLATPTGKMTKEIDLEITARIAACHTSKSVLSEEDFNKLKAPYDVTAMEYTAYHIKFWEIAAQDNAGKDEKQLEEEFKKMSEFYEKRMAELKANGCKFDTELKPSNKIGCYDDDGDNPDRKGILYFYGTSSPTTYCNPCKYEDECVGNSVKEMTCKKDEDKCKLGCWENVMHKCQFGCFAGRCLTEDESKKQQCDGQCLPNCPAGTMDFGENGCPIKGNSAPDKCCKKIFNTSTPPTGTCAGICAKSDICPDGYEKKDNTSCAQIETKYKCGLFKWFDCYNYVSPTCCVLKAGVTPPKVEQCAGECTMGDKCNGKAINKGTLNCESFQKCKPCGFFGLKKCCEYVPTTCCEQPKPITSCAKGMCTFENCPAGMEDVGQLNCGTKHKCHTCYLVAKCCDDVPARCCMATGQATCAGGKCQKDSACPTGYKSTGPADCGSYEKSDPCGLLGMAKCNKPAPMTCCMPE